MIIYPLVSILIANYNNSQFIEETLDSVINQTYQNIEIIIIDDASYDNSVEIINEYITTHPQSKFELYKNKTNYGCGRTKKICVDIACGDYFAFLDPEDTIEPYAIEMLIEKYRLYPESSIVYSTHYLCNDRLEPQSISDWPGQIPKGESHLTSTHGHISAFALCNRKLYDTTLGIDPKFPVAEDQDLYYKMEEAGPVLFINQPLYYYRKHEKNISWGENRHLINAYWALIAAEDAYHRRKKNRSISNLTFSQIKRKRYLYNLLLFKSSFKNRKYIKSAIYFCRSISYIYTDNHFFLLRTIKNLAKG